MQVMRKIMKFKFAEYKRVHVNRTTMNSMISLARKFYNSASFLWTSSAPSGVISIVKWKSAKQLRRWMHGSQCSLRATLESDVPNQSAERGQPWTIAVGDSCTGPMQERLGFSYPHRWITLRYHVLVQLWLKAIRHAHWRGRKCRFQLFRLILRRKALNYFKRNKYIWPNSTALL